MFSSVATACVWGTAVLKYFDQNKFWLTMGIQLYSVSSIWRMCNKEVTNIAFSSLEFSTLIYIVPSFLRSIYICSFCLRARIWFFFMPNKVEKHCLTSLKLWELTPCVLIMNSTCCHTERPISNPLTLIYWLLL